MTQSSPSLIPVRPQNGLQEKNFYVNLAVLHRMSSF